MFRQMRPARPVQERSALAPAELFMLKMPARRSVAQLVRALDSKIGGWVVRLHRLPRIQIPLDIENHSPPQHESVRNP